jgi:membrane associated rhomboid family serine protease
MEQKLPMRAEVRHSDRQPVFFVPRTVIVLIALMVGVHALRILLLPEYDNFTVIMFGILPGRYWPDVISTFPGGVWSAIPSFVTYAFLHANYTHLAINSAWLLAFGTAVVRKIGTPRFLILYLICAVIAALVHILVDIASLTPMVGASGAISGLMGAAFRFSMQDIMEGRTEDVGPEGRKPIRLLSLNNRNFLSMSAVWLTVNIIFGLTGIRVAEHVLLIAWDAHIAGFVAGALLIGVFVKNKKVSGAPSA